MFSKILVRYNPEWDPEINKDYARFIAVYKGRA
jgi:hypothetical protein